MEIPESINSTLLERMRDNKEEADGKQVQKMVYLSGTCYIRNLVFKR